MRPFAARVLSPALAALAAVTDVNAMAGVGEVIQDMVDKDIGKLKDFLMQR